MSEIWSKMYIGIRVKYPQFLTDFNETFSRQIFGKSSKIKFHENPFSESRAVPCGRTDGHKTVTFCNFTNEHKKFFPTT